MVMCERRSTQNFGLLLHSALFFLLEANENLYANIINLTQGQGKVAATIPSARQMLAVFAYASTLNA